MDLAMLLAIPWATSYIVSQDSCGSQLEYFRAPTAPASQLLVPCRIFHRRRAPGLEWRFNLIDFCLLAVVNVSTTFQMNHLAVILTSASRRILWVNKDFEYITGYELHEVMGMSPGQILQGPDTELDIVQRIRDGLAAEKPFKETITNYRKNGESTPAAW